MSFGAESADLVVLFQSPTQKGHKQRDDESIEFFCWRNNFDRINSSQSQQEKNNREFGWIDIKRTLILSREWLLNLIYYTFLFAFFNIFNILAKCCTVHCTRLTFQMNRI